MQESRGGEFLQVLLVLAARVSGVPWVGFDVRLMDRSIAPVELSVCAVTGCQVGWGVAGPQISQEADYLAQLRTCVRPRADGVGRRQQDEARIEGRKRAPRRCDHWRSVVGPQWPVACRYAHERQVWVSSQVPRPSKDVRAAGEAQPTVQVRLWRLARPGRGLRVRGRVLHVLRRGVEPEAQLFF